MCGDSLRSRLTIAAPMADVSGHCQVEPYEGGEGRVEMRVSLRLISWAHSAQGDVLPDGVPLGAQMSIS